MALGVERDVWLTLPCGTFDMLGVEILLPPNRLAPVARGEHLGRVKLVYNGLPLNEWRLVAQASVPQGGLAKRTTDRLRLWFREWGQVQATP